MLLLRIKNDFLFRFLANFKLSPIILSLVTLFVFNTPFFLYALATNNLYNHGNTIGLLNDPNFLLLGFISIPVTIGFYLWLPYGMSQVIAGLVNNKIVKHYDPSVISISDAIKKLNQSLDKPFWLIAAFVGVLLYEIFVTFPQHLNFKNIVGTNIYILVLYEVLYFPAYYATILIIIRVIIFTSWLSEIFSKNKVILQILHPDECGGMGFVGNYATKTGYIIGTWGLAVTIVILTEGHQLQTGELFYFTPLTIMPLAIYMVLAPLAFFAPIWKAQSAMKKARDEQLEKISDETDSILMQLIYQNLNTDLRKTHLERLNELERLHSIILKTLINPFRIPDLVSYLAKVWGALFFSVISTWIGSLIK